MERKQDRLLEIYKLHSELVDGVSRRREGANRLYVSLHVGVVVFLAALLRFGSGTTPESYVLWGITALGFYLCASWMLVILSYQQLNREKFRVLRELEGHLPFQFFTKEWDPKSTGRKSNQYWKLTYAETTLPMLLIAFYMALAVVAFFR